MEGLLSTGPTLSSLLSSQAIWCKISQTLQACLVVFNYIWNNLGTCHYAICDTQKLALQNGILAISGAGRPIACVKVGRGEKKPQGIGQEEKFFQKGPNWIVAVALELSEADGAGEAGKEAVLAS